MVTIFDSAHSFPHTFHIYTKSTATPTYHRNFALDVFFSGRNFQNMPWSVETFIQSRVPRRRPFFQFNEQRAKFVNEVKHLTRFIEKVDSELPSGLMMLIRQPLKMKNGCELTKNPGYTICKPLLQFTKQNDNATMTFPVNSSLQCLRTAALSMVVLNMESQNPMGRVHAENRSKTQKPLGFKGHNATMPQRHNDVSSKFEPSVF